MSKIVFDPRILAGKPIIKGTRISVEFILELMASGMGVEDILYEYTHLKKEDVLEAISYAARTVKHEDVLVLGKITQR